MIVVAVGLILGPRKIVLAFVYVKIVQSASKLEDTDHLSSMGDRKRSQCRAIQYRENARIESDAERDSEYRYCSEPRILAQGSRRIANVVPKRKAEVHVVLPLGMPGLRSRPEYAESLAPQPAARARSGAVFLHQVAQHKLGRAQESQAKQQQNEPRKFRRHASPTRSAGRSSDPPAWPGGQECSSPPLPPTVTP